jgi:thiamine biosynthesis lipoprotein
VNLQRFMLGLAILCITGCGRPPDTSYEQQLFAFGTLVDISLYGVEPTQAHQAVQAIDSLFQRQHHDWHAWQRGALDDLNRAISEGRSIETTASLIHLIQLGQRFEQLSGGLFNPAIGHLLNLWGFQQDEPNHTPPDPASIRQWLQAAPSMSQLHISGSRINSDNPAVKLDFGGFAKGYSVALAVELLEERGIRNLIVNAGGDLCLRGRHGDRLWRIGIRAPDGQGVLASMDLEGSQCVFTSGDYERYFEFKGKRYSHIIDPRSGYPAVGARSVTVLAGDATLADAAATALFVAGPGRWPDIARSMGIRDVLLIDTAGGAHMTDTLQALVHFERPPTSIETVTLEPPGTSEKGILTAW